jgi:hypothetical protein
MALLQPRETISSPVGAHLPKFRAIFSFPGLSISHFLVFSLALPHFFNFSIVFKGAISLSFIFPFPMKTTQHCVRAESLQVLSMFFLQVRGLIDVELILNYGESS